MTSPRNRIVLPAVINKQKVNKTSASRCSNQRRTLIIHKQRFNGGLASFMSERQQSPQQNIKQNDRHNQDAGARKAKPLSHSAFGQQRRPASAILVAVAGVSETLDSKALSFYPRGLFKNITSTRALFRA